MTACLQSGRLSDVKTPPRRERRKAVTQNTVRFHGGITAKMLAPTLRHVPVVWRQRFGGWVGVSPENTYRVFKNEADAIQWAGVDQHCDPRWFPYSFASLSAPVPRFLPRNDHAIEPRDGQNVLWVAD